MFKKHIDNLIIIILGFYSINGIIVTIDESFINIMWRIKQLLMLIFPILLYNNYGLKAFKKTFNIAILIWIIYLLFFYKDIYIINPLNATSEVSTLLSKILFEALIPKTFFYWGIIIYIKYEKEKFITLAYKYVKIFTIVNIFLLLIIYKKYGLSFFVTEALVYTGGITLISFSYNIVFTIIINLYLFYIKRTNSIKINRTILLYTFIINLILIITMGKRGALLSVFGPVVLMWIFSNNNFKKALLSITCLFVTYIVIINNIDIIIDFIGKINNRLGEAINVAYYYGDNNGREVIYEHSLEQIKESPITGYYPVIINNANAFFYGMHPHSIWYESLMTMGYLGSIILWGYMLVIIKKIYFSIKINSPYLFFGILFISEIIHGSFSTTLYDNYLWLSMFVLASLSKEDIIYYNLQIHNK